MIIKKIRNSGYKKDVRNRAKPHETCAISHGAHILNMIAHVVPIRLEAPR